MISEEAIDVHYGRIEHACSDVDESGELTAALFISV